MSTVKIGDPDLEITVTCEEEDIPIKGNALASGDDDEDRKAEKAIREDLESGNPWAWCVAHVRVVYRGVLTADDYLGACSYASAKDFTQRGGYYDDMVATCIDEINSKLAKLVTP